MGTDCFERIAAPTDRCPSRRQLLATFATAGAAVLAPAAGGQPAWALQRPPGAAIPHTIAPDASRCFRAVAERLLAAMEEHQVPGAALGILADGREEHATFGVASLKTNAPITADTRFQIGSLTKTYTGTAVMRLIDQGKLDLDATVRTYLPNLQLMDEDVAARVTVRHLLTHTGGWWADDISDTGNGDDAIARYVAERLPTFPQLAPLGAFFSYNNTGFTLLGRLIEVVTGQTYRAAVQDLVLNPLGTGESTFAREEVEQLPHVVGHGRGSQGMEVVTPLYCPRNLDPAGGLWSTTRDQLRYARFHLGDGAAPAGSRLLAPHTLGLMRTPQVAIFGGSALAMGLPWFVQALPGLQLVMHGGDTFGQHTAFMFAPWRGFALVLFVNAEPADLVEVAVVNEAVQRYLGLSQVGAQAGFSAALGAPTGTPTVVVPADELAQYAGRYSAPDTAYVLRVENGRLRITVEQTLVPEQIMSSIAPPPGQDVPVSFLATDLGFVEHVVVPFVRKPNGHLGWIQIGLRLQPRSEPPLR
jgi:CubicO group peptidase (beta-lactamase class C family)